VNGLDFTTLLASVELSESQWFNCVYPDNFIRTFSPGAEAPICGNRAAVGRSINLRRNSVSHGGLGHAVQCRVKRGNPSSTRGADCRPFLHFMKNTIDPSHGITAIRFTVQSPLEGVIAEEARHERVRVRTRELASIAGRDPWNVSQGDYEQAKQELMGKAPGQVARV